MAHGLTGAFPRHKGATAARRACRACRMCTGPGQTALPVGRSHVQQSLPARLAFPGYGITPRVACCRLHRAVRNSGCRSCRYWLHGAMRTVVRQPLSSSGQAGAASRQHGTDHHSDDAGHLQ